MFYKYCKLLVDIKYRVLGMERLSALFSFCLRALIRAYFGVSESPGRGCDNIRCSREANV